MNNRIRIEPGGELISGPMHHPLPSVAPPNRADDSPLVSEACQALKAFADDLDREAVRQILPHWRCYTELGAQDVVAIMRRFPGKGDL